MNAIRCPNCGLWNPPGALRCDCGYDFFENTVKSSFSDTKSAAAAKERSEKNLPTILIRGIVFFVTYFGVALLGYLVFGDRSKFGVAAAAFVIASTFAAKIKIKVKRWF